MSIEELVLVIGVLCRVHYSNGLVATEVKIECIEKLTNCAVGPGGKIDRNKFKECREKYKDGVFQGESK